MTIVVKKSDLVDEKQAYYLILHVGGTTNREWPAGSKECERERKLRKLEGVVSPRRMYREAIGAMRSVGVYLEHMKIVQDKPDSHQQWRFVFRFPRYARRDVDAERLGESFIYSIELIHSPVLNPDHYSFVFRIPAGLVRRSEFVSFQMLEEVEENRAFGERTIDYPHTLSNAVFIAEQAIEAAWRIAPAIYQHEHLHRAVMFLSQSRHHFYVYPGELRDMIDEPDRRAPNSRAQTTWENALHNAFKAIEAVIGDPSRDDKKFFDSLRKINIDPTELVGYVTQSPISQVIREMNRVRDKKSAHGSLRNRALTVGEVQSYQECASYVVQSAIEQQLGQPVS